MKTPLLSTVAADVRRLKLNRGPHASGVWFAASRGKLRSTILAFVPEKAFFFAS